MILDCLRQTYPCRRTFRIYLGHKYEVMESVNEDEMSAAACPPKLECHRHGRLNYRRARAAASSPGKNFTTRYD